MKKLLCMVLILAGLVCGSAMVAFGESFDLPVQSVTLSYGDIFDLTGAVTPQSVASSVTLSTSDASVVAVQDGRIKAVRGGSAIVTASYGGTQKQVKVLVGATSVKSVTLSKKALTLAPGKTGVLTAKILPANASYQTLVWQSSDPSVVKVNQEGRITTVGLGKAQIKVSVEGTSAYAICQVTVTNIKVSKIKLNKTKLSVKTGMTATLTASVAPSNAGDTSLVWSSSNETVAKVEDGVVKGVLPGTATITATAKDGSGITASCTVKVVPVAVTSVTLSKNYISLKKDETITLSAKVLPENATYPDVTYTTSNASVATVSEEGVVKAVAQGKAVITCKTSNGKSDTLYVTVPSDDAKTTIVITAAGDITVGGDVRNISSYAYSYFKDSDGGYSRFLKNAASYFENDDLTVVNLESVITNATSYKVKSYVLKASTDYVKVLSSSSVEAACLANNHASDYGTTGQQETASTLKAAGITPYTGSGKVITVKGVKIGLVGFFNDSVATVKSVTAKMRKKCDILFVSFHWGKEFDYVAQTSMITLARAAVDAGADLVVGHHQHVVSGIEVYKGKYIVYGLGTLSSILANPSDKDTFLFRQKFLVSDDGVEDGGIQIIPFSMSSNEDYNDGKCRPLTGEDALRVKNKIRKYSAKFPVPAEFE